ncbi:M23 family metallopeptidase [Verrucomicrobium sp. BvORR106]|uniref:murein hydrolase activator EnvC family protein n=1 Tax=Verrucomicrobium sp. BvORR106 TaxID=1403819 RepID=UPI00068D053E|nr:M23 family metallopeptidase [Verrucomicrobium sp. BvORR106]
MLILDLYKPAVQRGKSGRVPRRAALMALSLALAVTACHPENTAPAKPLDAAFIRLSPAEVAALPAAVRFDAPMGTESGAFTYNAQRFRVNRHLGDDLNGIGGWNSDLGDPVYASGVGKVIYAGWVGPGWGNMVILAHQVPDASAPMGYRVYQTIYAHLDEIFAKYGEVLARGKPLGTVGTANGRYLAHLHFEVRESLSVYPGIGYADAPLDRVPPEEFLKRYRGKGGDLLLPGIQD